MKDMIIFVVFFAQSPPGMFNVRGISINLKYTNTVSNAN